MEMEHNTLMEATKEIQRIRELNEMDISSPVHRQKKFEKKKNTRKMSEKKKQKVGKRKTTIKFPGKKKTPKIWEKNTKKF